MKSCIICVLLQKLESENLNREQNFGGLSEKSSYEIVWCVRSVIVYRFQKLVILVSGITYDMTVWDVFFNVLHNPYYEC
jgi:hypothetical protein